MTEQQRKNINDALDMAEQIKEINSKLEDGTLSHNWGEFNIDYDLMLKLLEIIGEKIGCKLAIRKNSSNKKRVMAVSEYPRIYCVDAYEHLMTVIHTVEMIYEAN